jgi:hypothetical protein
MGFICKNNGHWIIYASDNTIIPLTNVSNGRSKDVIYRRTTFYELGFLVIKCPIDSISKLESEV